MAVGPFGRAHAHVAELIDHLVGWDRLPVPLGLAVLGGLRTTLRLSNLTDTETLPSTGSESAKPSNERYRISRTADGSYNNLQNPHMGSAGARFGRNVPNAVTFQDPKMLDPNPRTISRELLTREKFIPATIINLLAAAWLQFMVHDWLGHGKNEKSDPWVIPLEENDPWPERPMKILRTRRDPTRPAGTRGVPQTFQNVESAWWDASQLYGSSQHRQDKIRSHKDGKVVIGRDGLLPIDPHTGTDMTGVNGNWWIGISLMHNLFSLEHNHVCDLMRAVYPAWSDDDLFDHARLIIAALLAKIHTVEWTPAILPHPSTAKAMYANWFGLAGENIKKLTGNFTRNEVIGGIPGSDVDQFGVPYSITEEFLAVYKMHPLIPDDFSFRSADDNHTIIECQFRDVAFGHARDALLKVGFANAFYSCGTMYPGAVTLHNFPRGLQQLEEPTSSGETAFNDVAAIDILRMRERGVPRYNEFRKLMHRPPVRSFEELCENPEWREQIRGVYHDDIDLVDLMIGLYVEKLPQGFGFSDTAFRIFILMASRRLNSDRFFTTDFTPKVYTPSGMDYLNNTNFTTVVARHLPKLVPFVQRVDNPFAPWHTA